MKHHTLNMPVPFPPTNTENTFFSTVSAMVELPKQKSPFKTHHASIVHSFALTSWYVNRERKMVLEGQSDLLQVNPMCTHPHTHMHAHPHTYMHTHTTHTIMLICHKDCKTYIIHQQPKFREVYFRYVKLHTDACLGQTCKM